MRVHRTSPARQKNRHWESIHVGFWVGMNEDPKKWFSDHIKAFVHLWWMCSLSPLGVANPSSLVEREEDV